MTRRGFTLVEVLLVILVITILSVAGFSGIIQLQRTAKASEIQQKIINMMNRARSYALNGKQVDDCLPSTTKILPRAFGVRIDVSAKKIQLFAQKDLLDVLNTDCEILETYPDETKGEKSISEFISFEDISGTNPIDLIYTPPFADFSFPSLPPTNPADIKIMIKENEQSPTSLKELTFSTKLGIPE